MKRFLIGLGLLFACLTIGAVWFFSRQDVPNDDVQPSPSIDPGDFTFANPTLKKIFYEFDAAASRTAESQWHHEPYQCTYNQGWENGKGLAFYQATWSRRGPLRDAGGQFVSPNHTIQISLSTGPSSTNRTHIRQVTAQGFFYPEDGRGVRFDFWTSGPPATDTFELSFFPCRGGPKHFDSWWCDGPFNLHLPSLRVGGEVVSRGLRYSYSGAVPKEIYDQTTLGTLLVSPESFRDTTLELLDHLENSVRSRFDAGKLANDRYPLPVGWQSGDGKPQLPPWADEPLPEEKRQEALQRALAEIEQKRTLVRNEFRELHSLAKQTLPLLDRLDAIDR